MNIMDLFRTNTGGNANKGNPDPNANKSGDKPNVNDPANKSGSNKDPNDPNGDGDKKSTNPLDQFKGLFDNANTSGASKAPEFQLDPEAVKKLVQSMSFSDHVTPELAQKLQSGDATAMKEAFDILGRQTYSRIFEHLPVLTDKFINARLAHERQGLGGSVKQELTKNNLEKLAANNPVLKEQLDSIASRILGKYPDATPDWIAEQTSKYFMDVAKSLNPKAFSDFKPGEEDTTKGDHLPGTGSSQTQWADWLEGQPQAPKE